MREKKAYSLGKAGSLGLPSLKQALHHLEQHLQGFIIRRRMSVVKMTAIFSFWFPVGFRLPLPPSTHIPTETSKVPLNFSES